MSNVSNQAVNDTMATIREAISVVGLAHNLRALEGLVRIADDLIGDSCPALIDEEDMVDLRVELVLVRRGCLKQLSQDPTAL